MNLSQYYNLIEISKDTAKRLPEYLITYKKLANELVEEYIGDFGLPELMSKEFI